MRGHVSYANVVATLALVLATSGGALAAKHYLINSQKQINPKVLRKLTGKEGKAGATGRTGATGATGSPGARGSAGATGPPGTTGAGGSAVAYAHIEENGTIDAAHTSSNITNANVSHNRGENYIIHGLPFTVHNVATTIGFGIEIGSVVYASVTGAHEAQVAIYTKDGVETNENFWVTFN